MMQLSTVELEQTKEGYSLNGTDLDSCLFVGNISTGYMSNGVRHISAEECTETLLSTIERQFHLKVCGL